MSDEHVIDASASAAAPVGVRSAVACSDQLGEGPVWDDEAKALWWIDVKGHLLSRFTPSTGEIGRWTLEGSPGCLALPSAGLGVAGQLFQDRAIDVQNAHADLHT